MVFGLFDFNKRELNKIQGLVERINVFEKSIEKLSKEAIQGRTKELQQQIQQRIAAILKTDEVVDFDTTEKLDTWEKERRRKALQSATEDVLPEAFALVREA